MGTVKRPTVICLPLVEQNHQSVRVKLGNSSSAHGQRNSAVRRREIPPSSCTPTKDHIASTPLAASHK